MFMWRWQFAYFYVEIRWVESNKTEVRCCSKFQEMYLSDYTARNDGILGLKGQAPPITF